MKPLPPNQRRSARFAAGVPAVLHYRDQDHDCRAHNLSRSGTQLVGEFPRPTEQDVRVTLRSGAGDLSLEVVGRVAHVTDEGDEGISVGIEFRTPDPSRAAVLESLVNRVVEGRAPAPLRDLDPSAPRHEVIAVLEQIPLHHRVALALRALPKERGFLLLDPQLQVLEALARNPNLTRAEIVKLVRMPNLLPTTIEIMAKDIRWAKDEEFQVLIATHPRAPLLVAEKVVDSLKELTQIKVLRTPGLNPVLRDKLSRKFANRRSTSW